MAAEAVSKDPVAGLAEQQVWIGTQTQQAVQSSVQELFRAAGPAGERLLSLLHGDFLHEPLHAVLTDIPVGAWTVTVAFDLLAAASGKPTFDKVADGSLKLGVGGALLAACAGMADWSEIKEEAPRRIGSVHALLNIAATGIFVGSWIARGHRATRTRARVLALTAYGIASLSAHLGGNLVYEHGVGLRRPAFSPVSSETDRL